MKSQNAIFTLFMVFLFFLPSVKAQWSALESGTERHLNDIHFHNTRFGIAVGDTSTVLLTFDGGNSWQSIASGFKENFRSGLALGRDTLLIAGGNFFDGSVYRSLNAGRDWDYVGQGIDLALTRPWIQALDDETIFKSPNRGENWKSSVVIIGSTTILQDLLFPSDSIGYAFGNVGGFATYSTFAFRTADAGDTWTAFNEMDFPNANGYTAAAFPHPDTGYIFANEFERFLPGPRNQLFRLTEFQLDESGFFKSWRFKAEVVNDSMPAQINDAVFLSSQIGYAAAVNGNIYKTTNGGRDWTVDYRGAAPLEALFLASDGTLFAAGRSGTILRLREATNLRQSLPELTLQLFPNPACEQVRLQAPAEDPARLSLYNAAGQLVRQLQFTGSGDIPLLGLPKGFYSLEWRTEKAVGRGKLVLGCE